MTVVLMGVSGCGKTTVGQLLAERCAGTFIDGDSLHPPENIAKMAARVPLDDADRAPWLAAVRGAMGAHPELTVIACSALKRAYRDFLRGAAGSLLIVYLQGEQECVAERLASRAGHYMPAALLDSQYAALEEPTAEEGCLVVSVRSTPEGIVSSIMSYLSMEGMLG